MKTLSVEGHADSVTRLLLRALQAAWVTLSSELWSDDCGGG